MSTPEETFDRLSELKSTVVRTNEQNDDDYDDDDTIWYDTKWCFNVQSKADMSQFSLPHETKN